MLIPFLSLNKSKQPSASLDSCHVCVICSDPYISKEAIPSLLMCPVLSISKVKRVFKVMIPKDSLYRALSLAQKGSNSVFIWRNKYIANTISPPCNSSMTSHTSESCNISLTTFNCRGFRSSIDYLFLINLELLGNRRLRQNGQVISGTS